MRHAFVFAALLAAASVQAQEVYRCGSSYSAQPCAGGTALNAASLAPSAQDAARAREAALMDAQRADALEKARLAQEAKAPKAVVMKSAQPEEPLHKEPPAQKKLQKGGKLEQFTAVSPRPPKDKKKKS